MGKSILQISRSKWLRYRTKLLLKQVNVRKYAGKNEKDCTESDN